MPGVVFKAHTANRYQFMDNGDGTYQPYAGLCASLTRHLGPPVSFELKDKTQRTYLFDASGKLTTLLDPQ